MLKKILLFIAFTITFTCMPEVHAEVARFSVDEAVKMALENNLELQSKRKELEVLEQDIKIATKLKNPQFQSNILMGPVTEGNSSQFGVAVPIEIAKRGVRKKAALAQYQIVKNEVRAKEHEIKIEVMRAYFNVLYQKSLVFLMQEREGIFKEMVDIAKNKSDKIPSNKIDMLQADIRYKKQLVVLNKAKSNLLNAQFHLNEVLNLKGTSKMYDTQELYILGDIAILKITLPDYKTIENTALKYSYSIMIAEDTINKKKADLTVARHKVIPDATIAGGYAFQHTNHTGGGYVGAFVDLPLFNFYQADVNKAKVIIEKSKLDKDSYENKLKMVLKQEYNEFKYSKENIGYYKDILKESDEILKMSTARYKQGETQLLNLMIIENQRQELLMEYISAIKIYYNAYLDLMYNMGHDLLLEDEIFDKNSHS